MFVLNHYNMLSANDIDNVVELGSNIVSCRNMDMFKDEVLKDITRFLGAETGTLLTFSTQKKMNIGFNCSYGVSTRMHRDYVNGLFQKDPAVALLFDEKSEYFLNCANKSKVILLKNHIDYDNFTGGFFYNSFLRPLNIHHLLLMKIALRPDDDNDMLIGMHRPEKSGEFSDEFLAKATLLMPALTGAMGNLTARAMIKERQTIIQSLGEDMHHSGLMILNDRMDVLYQSPLFRQHFQQEQCDISSMDLPPEIFQACDEMKSQFSGTDENYHRKLSLCDNSLTCDIKAIATENANEGLRFIIYSSKANSFRVNSQFMDNCGLTDREKDVACQITLGLTNIQIAEKLGISMRTVENHLHAVYSKVKVQNRTSLINALSQGFSR